MSTPPSGGGPPVVTGVGPTSGSTLGGTTGSYYVTVIGSGFTGATAVKFGTVAGSQISVYNDNALQVQVPSAASAGVVDITVTTANGTSATNPADQFTYVAAPRPVVTGLSRTSGSIVGGITGFYYLSILGSGFTGVTAVNFGSTNTSYGLTPISDNAIQIIVPSAASAGVVDVTVTTPGGTSATTSADQFTYVIPPRPVVTGLSKTSGSIIGGLAGNDYVTLLGSGFTGATAVTFGTTTTSYQVSAVSDNALTVLVPSVSSTGVVDVTVTTPGGTSATSSADQFTYLAAPRPVVTGLSKTSGSIVGGVAGSDYITLVGSGFTSASAVTFGTTTVTSFYIQVYSDNALQVEVPSATSPGVVDVTVTAPGGTSATSSADRFTYGAAPQPVVRGISPASGLTAGGYTVYVVGSGLRGATGVNFGSTAATASSILVYSDNELQVTAPAAAAGTVDLTVTTPGGTSATSTADQFTYVTSSSGGGGLPTITAIGPTSGSTVGGFTANYSVDIIGSGFTGATAVTFGSTPATWYTVQSDNSIQALVPSASSTGTVDIKVTTSAGTSATSAADQFTYVNAPVPSVTGDSLNSGSTVGGYTGNYSTYILGAGFTGATAFSFGGNAATSFTVNSDTLIRAVVPSAASAGTVDIKVTTPGGTSATNAADQFTYVIPPTPVVTGISLTTGSLVGNSTGNYAIAILGSGFTGATAVKFGTTAAWSYTVYSDTLVLAKVPSVAAPQSVDITVTTPGGTSAISSADRFTYVLPPTPVVTGISPTSGSSLGNSSIYLIGTGFTGATAVTFGGKAGTLYAEPSPDTLLKAVTPPAGLATVYPVATDKVYPIATTNVNDPSANTTTYTYTWFPQSNAIQSQTTSLPVVSTMHNGPGTADLATTFFDGYGRPIWSRDPDGYLAYTEYDAGTGAVTKAIADVQTANTSDYNPATLPAGWSTPFAGGLNVLTLSQVDGLGRTTKLTDPNGNITYTVYKDPNHEVRTYPGWQTSTNLPTGPTLLTREDFSHSYEDGTNNPSYTETLAISKAPNVSNGQPDGSETFAMSDVQSLSRSYVSAGGQVYRTDQYFNPSGMTYTTDLYLGTAGTNYYSTLSAYDGRGRLYHTIRPTGTIAVTDFDGLGRPVDEKVGTSDANLVTTRQYQYDNGGMGDSNLTQETDLPGGGAPQRATQYFYDWRDRLAASKQGVQGSENDGTHRPILYYQMDNLGNVLTSQQYDGDGVTLTSTNGVPNPPMASLLRAQTTNEYDEQGRVYQTNTYSIDQSMGTVSANSLTTNTWYDHRGDTIKTSAPGGLVTKSVTDGAGRVISVYQTDGAGDSTWANASSVVNNNVLSEADTQYDADGNPILVIDKERFDNETATGALGNPTTSPKARDSYTARYYDAASRLTDQVDVGTNGGMTYTRPVNVPADSPTVLVTHTAYNAAGLVQAVTDPRGIVTQNTYDLLGRTTQRVADYTGGPLSNSSDQTTQYTYDGNGHVLTLTALLPGSSETTQYTYGVSGSTINSNDLLASVTYPAVGGPNTTETYSYDALGEVASYTDRNGTAHSYFYDVLGRQTSDQVTAFGANVDPQVYRLDTAYDTGDRPYRFTSYHKDSMGMISILNQVQRGYNGLGQLTSEAQSHSGMVTGGTPSVQYAYSFVATGGGPNHSRPVSMTYPNGRVISYNYATGVDNTISRLTSISDSSATLESYTYLGLDTVVQRSHPQNGVNQTYITPGGNTDGGDQYTGLDRFGRVVEQRWVNTSTNPNTNTDDFQYSYDQDGNVLTRSNGVNSSFNEQFTYDNLDRLTSFTRGSHTQTWSLDTLGNWSSFTNDGTTQTRTSNGRNEITAISNAPTPMYDNNGNTKSDEHQPGASYTYDAWNRLVSETVNGNSETFAYDGLGRRIRSTVGSNPATDLYYSAAWQVVEEQVGGQITAQYVWSPVYVDALIERDTSGGQRLYVQQDANWNVTALVDTSGNVQERYIYDPYGNTSVLDQNWGTRTGSLFSWLYLYQGGRLDPTSGLYNFRNRDLSPSLGRWMEQDPLGYDAGDNNLYGLQGSAPANGTDPSGLQQKTINPLLIDPSTLKYYASAQCHGSADGSFINLTIGGNIQWQDLPQLQMMMLQQSAPSDAALASARAFWGATGARGISALQAAGGAGVIYLGIASAPLSFTAAGIFALHGSDILGTSIYGLLTGELQANLTSKILGPEVDQALTLAEILYSPFIAARPLPAPGRGRVCVAPGSGAFGELQSSAEVENAISSIPRHYAPRVPISPKTGAPIPLASGSSVPPQVLADAQTAINDINAGAIPTWGGKWGVPHKNLEGNLPLVDPAGGPITYSEYYLPKAPGDPTKWGPNRLVIGSDGSVYITTTHYGQSGNPPFVYFGTK